MDGVLMSIKPEYVRAIVAGTKTVELRRKRPSFGPGTRVLIYSTAPSKKIEATFETGEVITDSPKKLWREIRDVAGVTRKAFDEYFAGCGVAYAIEVVNPRRVEPQVPGIRPPQSYMFLHAMDRSHKSVLDSVRVRA